MRGRRSSRSERLPTLKTLGEQPPPSLERPPTAGGEPASTRRPHFIHAQEPSPLGRISFDNELVRADEAMDDHVHLLSLHGPAESLEAPAGR